MQDTERTTVAVEPFHLFGMQLLRNDVVIFFLHRCRVISAVATESHRAAYDHHAAVVLLHLVV